MWWWEWWWCCSSIILCNGRYTVKIVECIIIDDECCVIVNHYPHLRYASCCVDVVAAQHINADAIIHFGDSCMSIPPTIPLLYVFQSYDHHHHHTSDNERVNALRAMIEPHAQTHSVILSTR